MSIQIELATLSGLKLKSLTSFSAHYTDIYLTYSFIRHIKPIFLAKI